MPISPVYQVTVLDAVPAVSAVAVKGDPATRIGGWPAVTSKNMCAAATADAADSDVAASLPTDVVSAACRFVAVCAGVDPMVNSPAAGGASVVAVSAILSVVPSGSVKENVIASPGLGLLVKFTVTLAGEPVGPVTVAPLSGVTPASFSPKTVGGVSSEMPTCVPEAAGMTRRP